MADSERKKVYCYVDETGQHTEGEQFCVAVIVVDTDREEFRQALVNIENVSGRHKKKWTRSTPMQRGIYLRLLLDHALLGENLYYAIYKNTRAYVDLTVRSTANSKNFSLQNALAIGVDGMQRNFRPMIEAVDRWRESQLSDVYARLVIYQAFIEGRLEVPRYLARSVHDLYFNPKHEELVPRNMWSLSNAFTSAFKELETRYHSTKRPESWLGFCKVRRFRKGRR